MINSILDQNIQRPATPINMPKEHLMSTDRGCAGLLGFIINIILFFTKVLKPFACSLTVSIQELICKAQNKALGQDSV